MAAPTTAPDTVRTSNPTPADAIAKLDVVELGTAVRGNDALVLLHGWGAPGDDLVSLGHEIARPNTSIFVPAAPLVEGSGRAWWHFDAHSRTNYAQTDAVPPGATPRAAVTSARHAVQTLVRQIHERSAPKRLTLAGFSQGAMLALDVALQCEPRIDRVAVLSGALLVESLPALLAGCDMRPRVLITHGRADPVVPVQNAEHAVAILEQHGYGVDFQPFDGVHQIPAAARSALAALAFGA